MTPAARSASADQRNALAPCLIGAVALFLAPLLIGKGLFAIILFVVSIMALIVAWFAIQARQWWWVPVFLAIAITWNPVLPLPLAGSWWTAAQPVVAVVFLVAGALVKVRRT